MHVHDPAYGLVSSGVSARDAEGARRVQMKASEYAAAQGINCAPSTSSPHRGFTVTQTHPTRLIVATYAKARHARLDAGALHLTGRSGETVAIFPPGSWFSVEAAEGPEDAS